MPENKQPVLFARTIIYELAQIRATVQHLSEVFLDDVANRHNFDDAAKTGLRAQFKAHVNAKAKKFYEHYSKEIGLTETKPGTGRT
jgi:hypothetical protein